MAAVIDFPVNPVIEFPADRRHAKPYDRRATHLIVSEVSVMEAAMDIASLADEIAHLAAITQHAHLMKRAIELKETVKTGFDLIRASARVDPYQIFGGNDAA